MFSVTQGWKMHFQLKVKIAAYFREQRNYFNNFY